MDTAKGKVTVAITAASYSGNKGAAAMLQSSIARLKQAYGTRLHIYLMSVYPAEDRTQCTHECVTVVPAQPQRVLFLAFPCAVCWRLFGWCAPVRALLLKNKMLKAYQETDLVIDEAGISFSDSRGWILNTYAFACAAIPLLLGVPVVKYSQAFGALHQGCNRILAALVLPKMKLVIARGRISYSHLRAAGIRHNVVCCADGAFRMPPAPSVEAFVKKRCKAWRSHTVALSVSSVVERRCKKAGIDYCQIMAEFIAYLTGRGCQVWMFANAARTHSKKPRNNDLLTGDAIARAYRQGWRRDNRLIWEHREMDAEEIRAMAAQCECMVASRFHAMVFALSEQVPVMLIGWSHKYQEVMEQFGISAYASDYSSLSLAKLVQDFTQFWEQKDQIRQSIKAHLPAVQKSADQNMTYILKILKETAKEPHNNQKVQKSRRKFLAAKQKYMNHVIDLNDPKRYMGAHLLCGMGYASDPAIRKNAASGGMVTALLCSLLQNHEIDGAWVVQTAFTKSGALTYQTKVAVTRRQIMEASSSVYMKLPMLAHLDQIRSFDGRVAVVLTPCMMRALDAVLQKDALLREKIVCKIGLFCSGAHDKRASEFALDHCRIPRAGAKRLYYRRGHWRGSAGVVYKDGSVREFSYTKSVCAYKNAYFFIAKSCLSCKDQFASYADISFGDIWLAQVKKAPVKYTGFVVRSKKALQMLERARMQGELCVLPLSEEMLLRSQMRALTFKYRGRRWNHALAGFLAARNRQFSIEHPELLKRVPMRAIYYYMCAIRVLLSW